MQQTDPGNTTPLWYSSKGGWVESVTSLTAGRAGSCIMLSGCQQHLGSLVKEAAGCIWSVFFHRRKALPSEEQNCFAIPPSHFSAVPRSPRNAAPWGPLWNGTRGTSRVCSRKKELAKAAPPPSISGKLSLDPTQGS